MFSRRQDFIPHEVAVHCGFDHFANFDEIRPLGNDAVPQGCGHIATVHAIFLHLKDDLAHGGRLIRPARSRKPQVAAPSRFEPSIARSATATLRHKLQHHEKQ